MKKEPKLTAKALALQAEADALAKLKEETKRVKSFPPEVWKKIENWGRLSGNLSNHLQNCCFTISGRVRTNTPFEGLEIQNGIKILDLVAEKSPELLIFEPKVNVRPAHLPVLEITLDLLNQIVIWDKKNKKLKNISYTFMSDLAAGKKPLTEQNKKIASWNVDLVQKCGFVYTPSENPVEESKTTKEE